MGTVARREPSSASSAAARLRFAYPFDKRLPCHCTPLHYRVARFSPEAGLRWRGSPCSAAGGPRPLSYEADFSRLDDVHLLADQLRQRLRKIDVLANNAGLVVLGKKTTVDGHEQTVQVNHLAGFLLAHLVREQLRGGRLVVTSSDVHKSQAIDPADLSANTGWKAYCASKAGLWNLTLGLARAMGPEVTVNGIAPGVVAWPDDYPEEERAKYLRRVPLAREGTPQDVANVAYFLATEGAYITGQIIRLDGGRSIT